MPSRRTPGGKRKAADLVPASEALSATLQGSGRILTPRQPGSSPGVAAAKAKAQVRRWRHARTHLQTMSVFFCINRARAAAGPLRRSRARAVWIAPRASEGDGGLTSSGLTVAASQRKRGRPREVDAKLQQAVDAWADEQNEAVNSASKAADAYAPPTPALAPCGAGFTQVSDGASPRPSPRVLCGAT
jgi:hypothetical protein